MTHLSDGMKTALALIASKMDNTTLDDLDIWGSTRVPECKYYTESETVAGEEEGDEDEVFTTPMCLYTDGDGGYISFDGTSEMFEDSGMTIRVLSAYCDVPYGMLPEIDENLSFSS